MASEKQQTYPQVACFIAQANGAAHRGGNYPVHHKDNPEDSGPHFLLEQ
jgi:hypothetical protein